MQVHAACRCVGLTGGVTGGVGVGWGVGAGCSGGGGVAAGGRGTWAASAAAGQPHHTCHTLLHTPQYTYMQHLVMETPAVGALSKGNDTMSQRCSMCQLSGEQYCLGIPWLAAAVRRELCSARRALQ